MSGIFTFMRILFLVVDFLAAHGGTRSPVESSANTGSLPLEQSTALPHTKVAANAPEKAVHELASSWCSRVQELRSRTTGRTGDAGDRDRRPIRRVASPDWPQSPRAFLGGWL